MRRVAPSEVPPPPRQNPETERLREESARTRNWKRWGPYLPERQWGTVREDYSPDGEAWGYFTHEQSRSRAYRWGEDGLLGICDRQGRLGLSMALWNEHDPILKERLFGLTNGEGNHGESVKEAYFYLDSTPTHSYMRALYKYPQGTFPYQQIVEANRARNRHEPEFGLLDTGIFDQSRYFDVFVEYAKAAPDDIVMAITIANRGTDAAPIHILPTLCYRNTWAWGRAGEGYSKRPQLWRDPSMNIIRAEHDTLGSYAISATDAFIGDHNIGSPELLFTENETNNLKLWGTYNRTAWVKDAFHDHLVHGQRDRINPYHRGTKAAVHYKLNLPAGAEAKVWIRMSPEPATISDEDSLRKHCRTVVDLRRIEADAFYADHHEGLSPEEVRTLRQGYAGLLWTKQFYHYDVRAWLEGDPGQPAPPKGRDLIRNGDWKHLYNRDVISVPDKWEYPWYAAWDLAFHMIPFSQIDPSFAREQLRLLLREWYMHPNGQLPAYEFNFSDVNPPVHAWAAWRVYKIARKPDGTRDRFFLAQIFHKLLINFTWWVNRKDHAGRNLFGGGFLGLDNIGVFDRSKPLPMGGNLEQADATAWMAFYAATMLSMALELARFDPVYDDLASKFFEHFVHIADAINTIGGTGLWDENDGFYYDEISLGGKSIPLRARSMVGLLPLIAVEVLDEDVIERLPKFKNRMRWFLENRKDLASRVTFAEERGGKALLAMPSRDRLEKLLRYMLDENEFLSPHGIRSLSRVHADKPFGLTIEGIDYGVAYEPGESQSWLFGGNSNWRGPVWFPVNYLIIEALQRYHHFYGDDFQVEFPTGSGIRMNLGDVATKLGDRLASLFDADATGHRPCHGTEDRFATDPHWRDLVLFHEYFHGDTGRGMGASHQTGWTALVLRLINARGKRRAATEKG
ncbi:MAG: glucosidase [Deltaproteobacteria bacterium]|nr:glucosidase [Deltaproteobacteria bacterium]